MARRIEAFANPELLVWARERRDFRLVPLTTASRLLPAIESRLLYLDHIADRGYDLLRVARDRDLKSIVAKWAPTWSWGYSQLPRRLS